MAEPVKVIRDARVDHIGFVGELQKRFADELKARVKMRLLEGSLERCSGDSFDALLVTSTTSSVDGDKFLRLLERKQITRSQFLAAVAVRRDAALECLSREDLAKISTEAPGTPQLRVSRIKGVEIDLVNAVRAIAQAIQ